MREGSALTSLSVASRTALEEASVEGLLEMPELQEEKRRQKERVSQNLVCIGLLCYTTSAEVRLVDKPVEGL